MKTDTKGSVGWVGVQPLVPTIKIDSSTITAVPVAGGFALRWTAEKIPGSSPATYPLRYAVRISDPAPAREQIYETVVHLVDNGAGPTIQTSLIPSLSAGQSYTVQVIGNYSEVGGPPDAPLPRWSDLVTLGPL